MADQYDFTWSNPVKPGFTVLPLTKDSTTTSLTLTGRGSANWGKDLQANLLKLLENFASPTAPARAVTGQLWYNTTTKLLSIYDPLSSTGWAQASGGTQPSTAAPTAPTVGMQWLSTTNGVKLSIWDGWAWRQIYPQPPAPVQEATKVAFVTEYNSMAATLNMVTGDPQGATLSTAYGYSQTTLPLATTFTMSNAMWLNLLASLTKVCNFLGLDSSQISTYGFMYEPGNIIPQGIVTMLASYNSTVTLAASLTSGVVRYTPPTASLEFISPTTGNASRSTTWVGSTSREVIATFTDAVSMAAYFNSGGKIQFASALTGAPNTHSVQWTTFLSTLVGTVKFGAGGTTFGVASTSAVGYYNLTASYTPIATIVNSANTAQVYTVTAKIDGTNAVHFKVTYTDPGTLYGGVSGTLNSSASLAKASAAYLSNPVIAYPTVTQTQFV